MSLQNSTCWHILKINFSPCFGELFSRGTKTYYVCKLYKTMFLYSSNFYWQSKMNHLIQHWIDDIVVPVMLFSYSDCLEVCTHPSLANQGHLDSFLRSAVTTGLDHPTQGVGRGQGWNLEEPRGGGLLTPTQVPQSGFPVLVPLAPVLPLSLALALAVLWRGRGNHS